MDQKLANYEKLAKSSLRKRKIEPTSLTLINMNLTPLKTPFECQQNPIFSKFCSHFTYIDIIYFVFDQLDEENFKKCYFGVEDKFFSKFALFRMVM